MSQSWAHEHRDAAPGEAAPRIRLFTGDILVDRGTLFAPEYQEVRAALIALRAGRGAEARARYLLESLGALDVDTAEHLGVPPDLGADYVLDIDGDIHALCSFGAYAVPQLRRLGWRIDVAPDYPCKLVGAEAPWYCEVDPRDEDDDWFSVELGIDVGGETLNLLPALLDLLDGAPDEGALGDLLSSSRPFVAVPLGDERYVPVPPATLRSVLEVVSDLYDGHGRGRLALPEARAAVLGALDGAFTGELAWRGESGEALGRARALARGPDDDASGAPSGLRATLRPYQETGLHWLQNLRRHDAGGVLADDMGLGKTLQTIAHIVAEKAAGRLDRPALVVAPTSLVGNWKREIAKFAPSLRAHVFHGPRRHATWHRAAGGDVVITTYPCLLRDVELVSRMRYHLLILDEAQTIKNPASQAHRAVLRVDARQTICLSGTPVENNLDEVWSLFRVAVPGLLGDLDSFRARYRIPIERDGKRAALASLRRLVAPYILRRTKDQVARDLPPKTEIVRPVDLEGDQRALYESIRLAAHARVRHAIRDKGLAASTITILDALMKLRQVCCDPRLVDVAAAEDVAGSAKLEALLELLELQLAQRRRVLIFSQFTSMLAIIAEALDRREVAYTSLTGATRKRDATIDAFQSGRADVFLISLKAGGTGLNLTRADTVIHYDPWWNPAAQAQATDRAYRIGQTRPVFVYNLIVAGSVEERMLRLQERKKNLASGLLGDGASGGFSRGDVDDLFAPLDDDGDE